MKMIMLKNINTGIPTIPKMTKSVIFWKNLAYFTNNFYYIHISQECVFDMEKITIEHETRHENIFFKFS